MRYDTITKYLREHRIISRWTTFNNSFQSALAIPEKYDDAKAAEALSILGQQVDDELECVYCGAPAATWDHLYNNVVEGRFSGYGNRMFNLVPACRTCNERKGAKHWRKFLEEERRTDLEARITVLTNFEARSNRERLGWKEISAEMPDLANKYDQLQTDLRTLLSKLDKTAQQIRERIRGRTVSA